MEFIFKFEKVAHIRCFRRLVACRRIMGYTFPSACLSWNVWIVVIQNLTQPVQGEAARLVFFQFYFRDGIGRIRQFVTYPSLATHDN